MSGECESDLRGRPKWISLAQLQRDVASPDQDLRARFAKSAAALVLFVDLVCLLRYDIDINWYNMFQCFNILQSILPAYQVPNYLFLRCGWGTIKGVSLPQCKFLRSLFHAEPCWFEPRACILAWAKQRQLWQANIRMANRTIARTGKISMGDMEDMETLSAISFWDKHGYPICFWQFIHVYHVYHTLTMFINHTHTLAICLSEGWKYMLWGQSFYDATCCPSTNAPRRWQVGVPRQTYLRYGRIAEEIESYPSLIRCLGHESLKALDNFDVHTSGHVGHIWDSLRSAEICQISADS